MINVEEAHDALKAVSLCLDHIRELNPGECLQEVVSANTSSYL